MKNCIHNKLEKDCFFCWKKDQRCEVCYKQVFLSGNLCIDCEHDYQKRMEDKYE